MNITITINTDNDALVHNCGLHGVDCGVKFNIRAMREVITDIANDCSDLYWHEVGTHKIYDVNGNHIGNVEISENGT